MFKIHRMVIATVLLITVMLTSVSAEELTLDDCIELALKHNQDVIRARNQVKIADGNVWQAFGAFIPNLTVSASSSETHTPRISQTDTTVVARVNSVEPPSVDLIPVVAAYETGGISKSYSIGGTASLTLFNGGRNVFNYLGARADKEYYEYLASTSEQNMIYNVKVTYFAYLRALDQKGIAEEAVKRGEEQYKLANSKYEVGSASKSDVLKAQVQYGNDKLSLIDAENRVKTALANLKYLIGLDVNDNSTVSDQYTLREYSGTEDEALKLGMANYPGLLAAEKNLTAAKYDVRSTMATFLPTWTASLSKGWANSRWSEVNDLSSEDGQWTFSTTLSLPIFQGFSRKRDMSRAKVVLNNARADLHYARNNVALNIKESYLGIERSREALNVAQENVMAAEEDMSLVQEKYNLGAATILELLDAQVSLITAQTSKINAEFDYNLAVAKLEMATGIK